MNLFCFFGGISLKLRNYRTSILLAATFLLLISTFWFMPTLAFIIFLSLLFQLLLLPPVDLLGQHMPRAAAAGIVLSCFLALAFTLLALVSNSFLPTFTAFVTDFPNIASNVYRLPIVENSSFLSRELDAIWNEMVNVSVTALKSSLGLILSLFSKAIDLVVIVFVTFYLLKDGEQIKQYLAGLFPNSSHDRVLNLFNRILKALRVYILSQLVICCITGVIVFSYYSFRDLPYASVFAMVSSVAEFIPVLGPTVASAFGVLLTVTNSPFIALQTAGFYLVLTQINHNIVYPNLIGKSLNLHPISVILGIILGGELLGAPGMFLAVPMITICKLVIEDIYQDRLLMKQALIKSRWLNKKEE